MACETNSLINDRAIRMDITAKRNDSFSPYVTILENGVPLDLSGYDVATMQVKTDSEDEDIVLTASLADGRILLEDGGNVGRITWDIDDDDMDIEPNTYVYDLELYNTSSDYRETVLEGKFIVNADVTRL
jgi:hypothetical protein